MSDGLIENGLNDIRCHLNRADIEDAELISCIEEAMARLALAATVKELLARPPGDTERRLLAACLALPLPKQPLAMPEHDLRSPGSSRKARFSWKKRPSFLPAVLRKRRHVADVD